jgi:TolA-binding protein
MKTQYFLVVLATAAIMGCASGPSTTPAPVKTAQAATFTAEEKAQMSQEEKVAIYNSQEEEKNQVICRRVVVTGSHRKRTVCRTIEQIQQEQDDARRSIQDIQIGGASDPAGGGGL